MDIPNLSFSERVEFVDAIWASYGSTDKYGAYTSKTQAHGPLTVKVTISPTGNKPKTYAKSRAIEIQASIDSTGNIYAYWSESSKLPHGYTEAQFRVAVRALLDKAYDENIKSMVKAVALEDTYARFAQSNQAEWEQFRAASFARAQARGLSHLADVGCIGRQLVPTAFAFLDGWCMAKGIVIPEPKPDTYPAVCAALLGFSQVVAQVAEFCEKHSKLSCDSQGFDLDAPASGDAPEPVATGVIRCMCCLDEHDLTRGDMYVVRPSGFCGFCDSKTPEGRIRYAQEQAEARAKRDAVAPTEVRCSKCSDRHDPNSLRDTVGANGLCGHCDPTSPYNTPRNCRHCSQLLPSLRAGTLCHACAEVEDRARPSAPASPSVCESCGADDSSDLNALDEYGTGRLLCADCAGEEGYRSPADLTAAQPVEESDPFSL